MKFIKTKYESVKLTAVDARVEGNTAVVTGVYRVARHDTSGRPLTVRSRFTRKLEKRNGDWILIESESIRTIEYAAAAG